MDFYQKSVLIHEKHQGKIETKNKITVNSLEDLSVLYTPGVAEPCNLIAQNENDAWKYTLKGNTLAVISDGSAVLGLGNIGPKAAIPVMEGKAMLFKALADVNAVPICLVTQETEDIINTIKNISPCFGGINLEDIAAPRCFEIEARLKEELDIPVFHDDQHGTAVCVLAGLINAHKIVNKDLKQSKVVINGAGAAGTAITKLLLSYGTENIIVVDKNGIINKNNSQTLVHTHHQELAQVTNKENKNGNLAAALINSDVFIGVSRPNLVTKEMVSSMNKNSIIFAMANPTPEIFPEEAKAGGAAVIGTGRADFPNMVNNIMAFPGIMKGALEAKATDINQAMCLSAAEALANCVPESQLHAENIFPHPLDKEVPKKVAKAVAKAAQ